MKSLYLMLFSLSLLACSQANSDQKQAKADIQPGLDAAIEKAKRTKDFRLLAMQGHKMTLPGVAPKHAVLHIKHCGVKLVKQPQSNLLAQQNEQRNKQQTFTSQYNQQILQLCQTHTNG